MKLDKSYKVRVTPEQSRQIQELLFALGGGWFGCPEQFIVQYTERPCFYVSSDGRIHANHSEAYFNDASFYSDCTEIQADDLIALLTDLSKSAENPLQDIELTPEFEAVEPRFKVGDLVYFDLSGRIAVIEKLDGSNDFCINNSGISEGLMKSVCLANQENYERLQATFPHINFEKPPKELMGSDLYFKKLKSGKKLVICAVSDLSDEKAIKRLQDGDTCIRVIKDCDPAPYHFIDTHGIRHGFAVPLNDETGEPLTEAMLDE